MNNKEPSSATDTLVEVNAIVMPAYKSDKYYSVVIQGGKYLGWKATYVGYPTMQFLHPTKGRFDISGPAEFDKWMKHCWDGFVAHANKA